MAILYHGMRAPGELKKRNLWTARKTYKLLFFISLAVNISLSVIIIRG